MTTCGSYWSEMNLNHLSFILPIRHHWLVCVAQHLFKYSNMKVVGLLGVT